MVSFGSIENAKKSRSGFKELIAIYFLKLPHYSIQPKAALYLTQKNSLKVFLFNTGLIVLNDFSENTVTGMSQIATTIFEITRKN